MPTNELTFENWGLIDYSSALQKQIELNTEVFTKELPGYLIFCSHPPVVTKGRGTQAGDIFDWDGETVEVGRGGRATYHGPSQLVIYPIVNLNFDRKLYPKKDVIGFLRAFENLILKSLKTVSIDAIGKSVKRNDLESTAKEETGIWYNEKKIASLGLGVKNWVSYHGAAINLYKDDLAFKGINPCGFSASTMQSLEAILEDKQKIESFCNDLKIELQNNL